MVIFHCYVSSPEGKHLCELLQGTCRIFFSASASLRQLELGPISVESEVAGTSWFKRSSSVNGLHIWLHDQTDLGIWSYLVNQLFGYVWMFVSGSTSLTGQKLCNAKRCQKPRLIHCNLPKAGWEMGKVAMNQLRTKCHGMSQHHKMYQHVDMGMDQYLLIPFLGGWTSIYQLFWCSPGVQGFDTLPHLCGTSAFTVRTVGKQQYITSGNVFSTCTASIPVTLITKIVTAVLSLQLNFKKLIPGVPLLKQCQIPSKSKVAFPHFERVNTWSQILALQGSNLLVPQKKDF